MIFSQNNFTASTEVTINNQHSTICTAFIDLVKAHDAAHDDLLIQNLENYGAPPQLWAVIKICLMDVSDEVKFSKVKQELNKVLELNRESTCPLLCSC
eukprot:CCRYP_000729-RA/>CCRYP_000729-RA protein AED:0.09 eAED:-0.05 QI:0/-1/0/1/-1/0/1/0/97